MLYNNFHPLNFFVTRNAYSIYCNKEKLEFVARALKKECKFAQKHLLIRQNEESKIFSITHISNYFIALLRLYRVQVRVLV